MGPTLKGKNLLTRGPYFGSDIFFPLRVVPMVYSNTFHVCYSLFIANNIIFYAFLRTLRMYVTCVRNKIFAIRATLMGI